MTALSTCDVLIYMRVRILIYDRTTVFNSYQLSLRHHSLCSKDNACIMITNDEFPPLRRLCCMTDHVIMYNIHQCLC